MYKATLLKEQILQDVDVGAWQPLAHTATSDDKMIMIITTGQNNLT